MAAGDGSSELGDDESKPIPQEMTELDPRTISTSSSSSSSPPPPNSASGDRDQGEPTDHELKASSVEDSKSVGDETKREETEDEAKDMYKQEGSVKNEDQDEDEDDDGDGDDDDDDEPRLKYATLTRNLSSLYRNGDSTSAALVAGDKMIVGTHNGNIHVFSMPSLQSLRFYRAHQFTVTSISISPLLSSLTIGKLDATQRLTAIAAEERPGSPQSSPNSKRSPRQTPVPRTASNDIYIATSSLDGNVCISSLIDPDDVQLRNFGRPVQAVALSPEYKSDRSYLSGGQAGKLILTTGGQKGKSTNATVTGATATANSWLGAIGLGGNSGTDKVLHSDEGVITTIKWSPSGKYVLWVNEHGIKIMRSNLHLPSSDTGMEWKRISHINRPDADETAGIWRPRAEWIDRNNLEPDEGPHLEPTETNGSGTKKVNLEKGAEEVLVGWGDQVWLIKVKPSKSSSGKDTDGAGTAEITANMKLGDCVISGISLYTQNILLVLAYMERKVKDVHKKSGDSARSGRLPRRNGLKPELRLIDMNSKEELESDLLPISQFETLASSDYHLAILPPIKTPTQLAHRGYLGAIGSGVTAVGSGLYTGVETVGQGMWDATMYGPRKLGANRIFGGSESIRSGKMGQDASPNVKEKNYLAGWLPGFGSSVISKDDEHGTPVAVAQGMKIFIHSPFDTVVAVRRNISDKLQWLIEIKQYEKAWELLNEHPEAAGPGLESPEASAPPTPSKASSIAKSSSIASQAQMKASQQNTLAEFFADSASMASSQPQSKNQYSSAEKEKRRIGELWLQQLVSSKNWTEAGEVAEKVLNTTSRWDHWVWKFISNKKFDEIAFHVPTFQITPPLPSHVYEMILGHYVSKDRRKFKELLDQWPSDLFDISSITAAIHDQIKADNVRKGTGDWSMLQECLAKLYLADGHYKEAVKCYIAIQDADTAMSLMKEHHLVDVIADDIVDFVLLRISSSQISSMSRQELEELSSDSIKILVDEATHGVIEVDDVVPQLQSASLEIFLFFYLRALWRGEGMEAHDNPRPKRGRGFNTNLAADEGKALVDTYADTAVQLFAKYDRDTLMEYLHTSTAYTYDKALKICEQNEYVEEQVYLLSKTGAMKKALFLIIDQLQDVSKAIAFAKDQDDQGLWNDFLDYSMSRPKFIAGLLAEVGTAIDPIELVKRIPSGLEIEGLKYGLKKMLREYDIQDSISTGAARVLTSEVAVGMGILREGRRHGIKFDVPSKKSVQPKSDVTGTSETADVEETVESEISPGHCAACRQAFTPDETETLIGFACGHVYHVPHLLHEPGEAENEHELSLPKLRKDDEDEDEDTGYTSGFTRSVGPKVTNARLLKDKVEEIGGCKICKAKRDKVPDT